MKEIQTSDYCFNEPDSNDYIGVDVVLVDSCIACCKTSMCIFLT